jgi:hypothetical protein
MAHQNIVLHEILTHLPWARFNALVIQHQSDKHIRTLSTKTMLITLLYAQLAGLTGLRETADATKTQAKQLRHLGVRPVAKSTLDDALHLRLLAQS